MGRKDEKTKAHIKARVDTADRLVRMRHRGNDADASAAFEWAVQGVCRQWIAGASVMPRITSANSYALSMMIGRRAAEVSARAV